MSNGWTGGQYSLFRALLGLYLAVHFTHLMPWAAEVFSSAGMLPDADASPLIRLFPNVLLWSDSPATLHTLLAAATAGALMLAIGWHDKLGAFLCFYALAALFGRNPLIANPALPYVGWMLLAHLLVPARPYGAWSARHDVEATSSWRLPAPVFAAAWLVLALSYSYSGYTKLLSPSWVSGDTVSLVLQNPLARHHALRELMLSLPPILLQLLTWGILWIELLFAPLALIRRLRPVLWSLMLVVQFGFLFLLNFADLTAGMLLFHLLTFDPAWMAARRAARPEIVFYDGNCGLCHRVVRFALSEDRLRQFHFAPLQGDAFRRAVPEPIRTALPDSFVIMDDRGRLRLKSDAVIHLLRRLGGLWRLGAAILAVLPRSMRDRCYDLVGRNRHRLFARPEGLCPVVGVGLRQRFVEMTS
jgi:predicted DCC family thiol-disulfide oxidoreductase YuxK